MAHFAGIADVLVRNERVKREPYVIRAARILYVMRTWTSALPAMADFIFKLCHYSNHGVGEAIGFASGLLSGFVSVLATGAFDNTEL